MKKFIFLIVIFGYFLLPINASAAEPTPECLALTKDQLSSIASAADFTSEAAAWQPLVEAGCLQSNPAGKEFADGDERVECQTLTSQGIDLLRPFNQQLKVFFQKVDLRNKVFLNNQKKITKKIKKAKSKTKRRKLKLIRVRLIKNHQSALKTIKNQNSELITDSAALFILTTGELKSKDCLINDTWLYINRFSWQIVNLVD